MMATTVAKLLVSKNGEALSEVALLKTRMTVGRRAVHDIHIDDPRVSHDHAAIVTAEGNSLVEDLDSTNGTFVNGARVTRHLLQHNDVIIVGEHQLRYVGKDPALEDEDDCGKTLVVRSPRMDHPEMVSPPPQPTSAAKEAEKPLPVWKNPKNQLAAALMVLALSIWGDRLYDAYRNERTANASRPAAKAIECKKLYSRVEAETMSPEKAHDAVLAAFKEGACKD